MSQMIKTSTRLYHQTQTTKFQSHKGPVTPKCNTKDLINSDDWSPSDSYRMHISNSGSVDIDDILPPNVPKAYVPQPAFLPAESPSQVYFEETNRAWVYEGDVLKCVGM